MSRCSLGRCCKGSEGCCFISLSLFLSINHMEPEKNNHESSPPTKKNTNVLKQHELTSVYRENGSILFFVVVLLDPCATGWNKLFFTEAFLESCDVAKRPGWNGLVFKGWSQSARLVGRGDMWNFSMGEKDFFNIFLILHFGKLT